MHEIKFGRNCGFELIWGDEGKERLSYMAITSWFKMK